MPNKSASSEQPQKWIQIDGETLEVDIDTVYPMCDGMCEIEIEGMTMVLAIDVETAGNEHRDYYRDMARNDPDEFLCMVGRETLVSWALGQAAGPGYEKVHSLDEWLELLKDYPEEHFATYDGEQRDVSGCSRLLIKEIGFEPTVAYRRD